MFTRLAVFAGGADLAAVHAVCAEPGTGARPTPWTCSPRSSTSRCWWRRTRSGGTRYQLLETLRAYGRERLSAGPARSPRSGTPRYFADLAARAAHGVQGPDEQAWVERALTGTRQLP